VRQLILQERRWQPVVTIDAPDFLHQVGGNIHVLPVTGHADAEDLPRVLHGEFERLQDARHLCGGQIDAEEPVGIARIQLDLLHARFARVIVTIEGPRLAACQLFQQLARASQRLDRQLGIHLLAEPAGCFATQSQHLARAPDAQEVEIGRLEQDARRARADLGICAAHHPGHRDGSRGVGDHQHLRIELPVLAIEGQHALAGSGATHDDGRPAASGALS